MLVSPRHCADGARPQPPIAQRVGGGSGFEGFMGARGAACGAFGGFERAEPSDEREFDTAESNTGSFAFRYGYMMRALFEPADGGAGEFEGTGY